MLPCLLIEIMDEFLCNIGATLIFSLGMNVRICKIDRYVGPLSQVFECVGATRGAAHVHENSWPLIFCLPDLDHFLHNAIIVDLLVGLHGG
ncbi:Uncharacterised protein [Chlamydia trachomatis]|nr:Uncharacterised protein [Chlamydia trachomatis]